MQLFVIDWSFQNNEDQLFATNEFCQYLNEGNLNKTIDGFDLKFIAHTPQNKSGVIICMAHNTSLLFKVYLQFSLLSRDYHLIEKLWLADTIYRSQAKDVI